MTDVSLVMCFETSVTAVVGLPSPETDIQNVPDLCNAWHSPVRYPDMENEYGV